MQKRIGLLERLSGVLPPELAGLQVQRIGLGIGRARLRRGAEQFDLQLPDHVGRDLVLDGEDVVELAVVGLRPQLGAGRRIDQLHGDPHRVAGPAHRAFQYVRHVQGAGDVGDRHVLALERERGGTRRHLQLRNLRQQVQQVLGDAVGEIVLVLVGTHVDEGQHRNGLVGRGYLSRGGCRRRQRDRDTLDIGPEHVGHRRQRDDHRGQRSSAQDLWRATRRRQGLGGPGG